MATFNKNFKIKNGLEVTDQIISTLVTGTSPFSVTSTTVNTNLNADLLDGNHAAAFPLLNAANTFTTGPNTFNTGAAGNIGLIVKGAASQTANLQEWQNNAGSILASLNSAGTLRANYAGIGTSVTGGTLNVGSQSTSSPTEIIRAAASQTADLTQWQNSAGAVLSKITSSGSMLIGSETVTTREYVQSRGMNMVANGSGMLGNNYNFSTFTFDATDVAAGKGSFLSTLGSAASYFTDEFIPVDPQKAYRMQWSVKQKSTSTTSRAYGMVICYDIDGLSIRPQDTIRQANTDTTLAQDLKPGDTVVYLTSAANWNNAAGASTHLRTIIVWGYTNSFGYTYPNYTYSRKNVLNAYADGGVNYINNTITLSSPWPATWGTIPAGTAISNGASGGTFKYIAGVNFVVSNTSWTTTSGEIQGIDLSGTNATYKFSPGTAFVKVGYLLNYAPDSANSRMAVSATSFTEVAQGNLRSLDASISGDFSSTWFRVFDSSRSSVNTLNVDLSNFRVGINTPSSGSTAPTGALEVRPYSTTEIGLVVRGAASQSANLQEWQDNTGTVKASIASSGLLTVNSDIVLNGIMNIAGAGYAGGRLNISTSTTTSAGIIVRGVTSQTADLQQWQDSSGVVLAKVDSNGFIYSSGTQTWSTYLSPNNLNFTRSAASYISHTTAGGNLIHAVTKTISSDTHVWSSSISGLSINPSGHLDATTVLLKIKGSSSQTANLQEWQDSAASVKLYVDAAGALISLGTNLQVRDSTGNTTYATINSTGGHRLSSITSSTIGLIVRGAASQTADLTQWQNSAGTVLALVDANGVLNGQAVNARNTVGTVNAGESHIKSISPDGNYDLRLWMRNDAGGFFYNNSIGGSAGVLRIGHADPSRMAIQLISDFTNGSSANYGARVNISTVSTGVIGLAVRGVASQAANLQEWQSSTGTVLSSISSNGSATFANLTVSGDFTVNGTTTNINTTNLVVEDKNIIIGDVTTPSDTTADGGGITLKGATDKTFNWINSTGLWTASVGLSAPTLTSTVATGTAPLTVTSTTAVTNLNADLLDGNHASAFATLSGSTFTGQIISTRANDANTGAGQIYLNGATGNRIDFNTNGTAAPAFTTRSAGTKIVLYPAISGSTTDYALGVESNTAWTSITTAANTHQFKWYAATTNIMSLRGDATLSLNSTSATLGGSSATHQFGVVAGAAANVGVVIRGTTSQTGNLQEWQNNTGTVLVSVDADGNINGRITDPQIIQYGAEGSILQNIPNRTHPAEQLLKQAVFWIDANHSSASGQTISNLGWAGSVLNATCGSSSSADSNDPKYLGWDGTNYVYTTGVDGNYLSVADENALDVTGDIDIRVYIAADDWTPSALFRPISKYGASGNYSWYLQLNTNGRPSFIWSSNGTAVNQKDGDTAVPFTDGSAGWVRVTLDVDNGAAGNDVKFFTSTDGVTWTQLGATITTAGVTSIYASTYQVNIGSGTGGANVLPGKIFRAQILNGINGTPVLDVDTSLITSGSNTSFTARTGQTVTINRSTSGRKSVAVTTPCYLFGTDDYIEVNNRWIPQGLNGQAIRLPGLAGNYLSVPDAAALDITGDIDIRVQVAMDDWTPGATSQLLSKDFTAYELRLSTTGNLTIVWSVGGVAKNQTSTTAVSFSDGTVGWVRATLDVDNGASGHDVKFWTSTDGVTWTQLGTTITTAGTTSIDANTSPLQIGERPGGSWQVAGKFYRAQILNGIGGTTVLDVDASRSTVGASTFTAVTGQTVTISGTGAYVIPAAGVYLPGVAGNYLSAPDSAALDVTGDIDIRVKVALDSWRPAAIATFVSKYDAGGSRSYMMNLSTDGYINLYWSTDGTASTIKTSTAQVTNYAPGTTVWVRATLDVDNGASGSDVKFWTSSDGSTWTQLGSTVTTAGTTSIFSGASTVQIGTYGTGGTTSPAAGRFYRAVIYSDLTETTKVFDANMETSITSLTQTTFTESSSNAATVTINKSGTGYVSTPIVQSGYIYPTGTSNLTPSTSSLLDFGATDSFTVLAVGRRWGNPSGDQRILMKWATTGYYLSYITSGLAAINLSGAGSATATAPFTSGTMSAIAGVRNTTADTVTVYVNGTAGTPTTDGTTSGLDTVGPLAVGRQTSGASSYADMELVAAAIFRRALTASEISTLSNYFQGRAA